jgi:hypothetical protein
MKITARQLFITKCLLWLLGGIIIPIFIWWIPAHIYETDKSTIKIENTKNGRMFEFNAENSFGHKLHAKYIPMGDHYQLIVDGFEICDMKSNIDNDDFIYRDTHDYEFCYALNVIISLLVLIIQFGIIIYSLAHLCENSDVRQFSQVCSKNGFYIKNEWGCYEDDFWFSKVFRLYITEEELINVNKFFGFENTYERQK